MNHTIPPRIFLFPKSALGIYVKGPFPKTKLRNVASVFLLDKKNTRLSAQICLFHWAKLMLKLTKLCKHSVGIGKTVFVSIYTYKEGGSPVSRRAELHSYFKLFQDSESMLLLWSLLRKLTRNERHFCSRWVPSSYTSKLPFNTAKWETQCVPPGIYRKSIAKVLS